jgi:hypothetical protein
LFSSALWALCSAFLFWMNSYLLCSDSRSRSSL